MKMTEEEIEHYEKYNAAYHEVGHAHIVQRFGGCCSPMIWKNPSSNEYSDEKSWLGTTKIYVWPGKMQIYPGIIEHPVPHNWEVLVGLAGLVAEYMHHGEDSAMEIASYIEDHCLYDEISESDRQLVGNDWSEDDVQELMNIFSEDWEFIKESVERLIFSCN